MPLVKRRKYGTGYVTGISTISAPAGAPLLLATHAAQGSNADTFLRARASFSASVQVDPADPPPSSWWPPTTMELIAWWSDSGSTAIGPAFGTSEHYLGSQEFAPRFTQAPTDPANSYVIQWTSDDDLIVQTSRKGSGSNTPHMGVGLVIYDPAVALLGTYSSIAINYQIRLFTLWGGPT